MSDDLGTAMWIGAAVLERRRRTAEQADADISHAAINNLVDVLGATNDRLVVTKAERDSYRRLSTEMVKELKGLAPIRLSKAEADDARKAFLGETYQQALASHERDMMDVYRKQNTPEGVDRLVNNSARKKNGGKLR